MKKTNIVTLQSQRIFTSIISFMRTHTNFLDASKLSATGAVIPKISIKDKAEETQSTIVVSVPNMMPKGVR
jgi:hypothetical protein